MISVFVVNTVVYRLALQVFHVEPSTPSLRSLWTFMQFFVYVNIKTIRPGIT